MEITSLNNEIVKEYSKLQQKKYRKESGKFLLEGYKAVKEALDFGIELEKIFVKKNKLNEYDFDKGLVIETNSAVLKKLSTTENAPSIVAVGIQKKYDKKLFKNMKKVVLLENIKDCGNLGTIIRSSCAFGSDGIVLYGDSVDLYNPKSVRASVGNLWKIPVIHIVDFQELQDLFGNFSRISTLPLSNNYLKQFKPDYPILLMFGSEADGLSEDLKNFATDSVKIEMNKNVESLNLATSVSVILYQIFEK